MSEDRDNLTKILSFTVLVFHLMWNQTQGLRHVYIDYIIAVV